LPTPETISRPVAFSSSRTAAEKAGPRRSATRWIASASRTRTRRPRPASSLGPVRAIATPKQILRKQAMPPPRALKTPSARLPTREPHDEESGGAEQADAEAVLDVKALEFYRMIADRPDVDAIVCQDAVDVEADELEAAGDGRVEHCHLRARAGGTALARSSTTALPPPWDLAAAVSPARAACHTSRAMLTMPASWSSGIMFEI